MRFVVIVVDNLTSSYLNAINFLKGKKYETLFLDFPVPMETAFRAMSWQSASVNFLVLSRNKHSISTFSQVFQEWIDSRRVQQHQWPHEILTTKSLIIHGHGIQV